MKNIFKICALLIVTMACFQQTALTIEENPYYTCPSDKFYTPTLTLEKYCQKLEALCDNCLVTIQDCKREYKKEYGQANFEYKYGKCKINDRKFIEGTYNTAICKVDFITGAEPQIMGIHAWVKGGLKGAKGQKCINMLTNQLKEVYPDIEDYH